MRHHFESGIAGTSSPATMFKVHLPLWAVYSHVSLGLYGALSLPRDPFTPTCI